LSKVEFMRQVAQRQNETAEHMEACFLRAVFPEYTGSLPQNWQRKTVRQLSTAIQYGLSEGAKKDGQGPKLLRITDIQDGRVNWSTVPKCDCGDPEIRKYGIKDGDIFFVRTGATTGKSFLIRSPPERTVYASYLIRVQCDQAQVLPEFLYAFFRSPTYWGHVGRTARGGTLAGLNATMLGKLSVPHPKNLDEQRAVVSTLTLRETAARRIKSAAARQLEALVALPGAILREAFDFAEDATA
jgi:type I restriction enzyme S subunit